MNQVEPAAYRKLKAGIQKSFEEAGRLALPIVVRTHPTQPGKWQIIDGYHRWKVCQELNKLEADVMFYECDDKRARLLTDSLNYLRGDRNPEKYIEYIRSLADLGVSKEEITKYTNVTSDELTELADTYDIKLDDVDLGSVTDGEEKDEKKDPDAWVKLEFSVPQSAAEVIEAEIARVSSTLTGKNVRGRALEYVAVQSAQTPLPGTEDEAEDSKAKQTKTKLGMLAGKKRRKSDVDE